MVFLTIYSCLLRIDTLGHFFSNLKPTSSRACPHSSVMGDSTSRSFRYWARWCFTQVRSCGLGLYLNGTLQSPFSCLYILSTSRRELSVHKVALWPNKPYFLMTLRALLSYCLVCLSISICTEFAVCVKKWEWAIVPLDKNYSLVRIVVSNLIVDFRRIYLYSMSSSYLSSQSTWSYIDQTSELIRRHSRRFSLLQKLILCCKNGPRTVKLEIGRLEREAKNNMNWVQANSGTLSWLERRVL